MTDVWGPPGAGSNVAPRKSRRRRAFLLPATCSFGAAIVLSATLLPAIAPAGADQVSNLQAEAAQLSKEMLLEQMQISGYQQQHDAALAQVTADDQQITAMEDQITVTRRHISQDLLDLRKAAVRAYVDGGTIADGATALFSDGSVDSAPAVYDKVMTGDVTVAVDHLRSARRTLDAQVAQTQQLAAQAQQAATQAQVMLADAQSTQQTLQQQTAQVNGQLAAAVEAQRKAAAAAAAAALAAAQQAAAQQAAQQRAASAAAQPPGGGAVVASTSAPALNSFLRCVVQAESGGNYGAVSPTGQYMGAFQFSQPTWNEAALLAGRPTLVGVRPNQASVADQDDLAIALYQADGEQPWYDPCRS